MGSGAEMLTTNKLTLARSSPLWADVRPSTPRLGGLTRGKGISCAAGSGGTSPSVLVRESRGGREVWAGSGRLCRPVLGRASEAADRGLPTAARSLLSGEADPGTSPLVQDPRSSGGYLQ